VTDTSATAQPTLFVSHGAPNLLLGDLPVKRFLEGPGNLVARRARP
jgi:aromatic ring-opening dioxygenase catalytic subunit (LigB family)